MRHFIRTILERLRTKAQPRARQQQTEERKPDEQADDRHVGMVLDGDRVGIQRDRDSDN